MFLSILTFIIFLSILVLVHELGHYVAARRAGIWVEEFGFGIPPRIFGIKRGETIYSLNLFPFGGFVRLHGEDDTGDIKKPQRAFVTKSWGTRMLVVYAGVFMNIVLGIVAFSIVYTVSGVPKVTETGEVRVVGVAEGSPAQDYGIAAGDVVREVGGKAVATSGELTSEVDRYRGQEVILSIVRGGEVLNIPVVPRENPPKSEGSLGLVIASSTVESYFPPLWQRPFYGIWYGLKETFFWGSVIVLGLIQTIGGLLTGEIPKDLVGPTGLYAVTTEVAKRGLVAVTNWIGIISVNLAILNILPFPALDGGRGAFLILEKLFGKKVKPKVEGFIHTFGLLILVGAIIAVTYREVSIISKLGLSGYIDFITQGQGL